MSEFPSHISNARLVTVCREMGVRSGSEFIIHKYVAGATPSLDSSALSTTVSYDITEEEESTAAESRGKNRQTKERSISLEG